MKHNALQIATLGLCALLLVTNIVQSRRLEETQRQLENRLSRLDDSVTQEIRSISDRLEWELEEAGRSVADYALEPRGIDTRQRALVADLSVSLKQWYEDTQLTLLAQVGEKELSLPLTAEGSGAFTGQLSLPLEGNSETFLDVLISGGGTTTRESLGGWSDFSMLLPLRNGGGGWSGPEYQEGVLSSQFNIHLEGPDGMPGPIRDPEFRVYKNGELVQTLAAVVDPHSSGSASQSYTVDTEDHNWSLECDSGDTIDIRFRCVDEYGLGYDFLFQTWVVDGPSPEGGAGSSFQTGGFPLTLFWPE